MPQSLYQLLGLDDFSPDSLIAEKLASTPAYAQDKKYRLAIEILSNGYTRGIYDKLLEGIERGAASFSNPDQLFVATKLAKQVGMHVSPGPNQFAIRIAWEAIPMAHEPQRQLTPIDVDQATAPAIKLGDVQLFANVMPYTIEHVDEAGYCQLVLAEGYQLKTNYLRSGSVGGHGTMFFVVRHRSSFLASYFDAASGEVFLIQDAGQRLFGEEVDGGPGQNLADDFGIRNKPNRIRSLVTRYYDWLANLIAKTENLPQPPLRNRFRQVAGQHWCNPVF